MPRIAPPPPRPARRPGLLARFARARSGATAVEFGLLALPFLGLVFATFELGMMFLVSNTLESAAQTVARTVRTGQFQTSGASASDYKTAICNDLGWLQGDCQDNLYVDVRTFPSFAAVTAPSPVVNGAVDPTQLTFQTGGACAIVLARAFYKWTLLAPGLSGVVPMGGGQVLLSSAGAFRNEPFSGQSCPAP